jgi:hypothetical protein
MIKSAADADANPDYVPGLDTHEPGPAELRPVGVRDLMLVIGAIAGGLITNRFTCPDFSYFERVFGARRAGPPPLFAGPHARPVMLAIQYALQLLIPHLLLVGLVIVLIHLGTIRCPFARRIRRPGFAAVFVATLAGFLTASWVGLMLARNSHFFHPQSLFVAWFPGVGFAILGAWTILRAGDLWQPNRGWLDRAGRAIGDLWLIVLVLHFCRYLFG